MTRIPLSLFLGLAVFMVAGLLPFPAFAQQACPNDGSLSSVFCSMALESGSTPRVLAVFSYAMGAVMTLGGLLNLRQYGDDPSSIPLRTIIMKFSAAVMLISLPLIMQTIIKTTTGKEISAQETVSRPCLYRKSNLMQLRGKGDSAECK
jgi:hypothetical protein